MINKSIIKNILKVYIKCVIHGLYRIAHFEKKLVTNNKWKKISSKKEDVFFGYYDISPFNNRNYILYIKKRNKDNYVRIVINNDSYSKEKILGVSYAWNWQQGCRLRWFPNSNDKIIFNIFEDGNYKSRLVNTEGEIIKDYKYPFYDIDGSGKYALTLNFSRLGRLRPGYGYTCLKDDNQNLEEESIKIVNLDNEIIESEIKYKDIAKLLPYESNLEYCYINHLSFSPDGKKFLFFWIEIVKGYHKASLMVYDIESKTIIPLEVDEKISHYTWFNNNVILCTSYKSPGYCRYYKYDIDKRARELFCPKTLLSDGHPSFFNNKDILTDTYPDKNGYQYLYIVNSLEDKKEQLLKIYMKPVTNGEWRTDLHPRFNSDKSRICIDTNTNGFREIIILDNKN